MRRSLRILLLVALTTALSSFAPAVTEAAPARAASPSPPDAPQSAADAKGPAVLQGKPSKPPVQGYVSRGVRSRFCFGMGLHIGVNSLRKAKQPHISGFSVHFRMSGVAGLSLEYDFNRVAKTPDRRDLSPESLHFIPNLRVAVVLYPYRWRLPAARTFGIDLAPYFFGGMGIDTVSTADRANFQLGLGLEITLWHSRIAVLAEVRAFLPRPSDVEQQKERLEITGADNIPDSSDYYEIGNLLFTLSVRFYY